MKTLDLLAFDVGASNGRGIVGRFDGRRLTLHTVGYFENNFAQRGALCFWDYGSILGSVKDVFKKAYAQGFDPQAFGIDTWGVDYGLLDAQGALIEDPRAYRSSTDEEMHAAWALISRRELFERTGIAALNFNTVFQLYRRVMERDPALRRAQTLLFMPDLLGYSLTGEKTSEYTIASTSGLLEVHSRAFCREILSRLSIPERIFTQLVMPGALRGRLTREAAAELGAPRVPFATVGAHDTASAVAAIPGEGDFAFCSSGTWSLFGIETEEPVLSDFVYDANFANEGTVQGGYRPLKNIMGLWLIQECRRAWAGDGEKLDWEDIKAQAAQAAPLRSVVDPDHPEFYKAGDMPGKIRAYCRRTGQPEPGSVGELARCVYESLALKYRWAVERLGEMKGRPIRSLNITGGGIQNLLLNQMAADATGLPVTAGPIEGAAMGNALLQAVALGEIKNLKEARQVVRDSVETRRYEPRPGGGWDEAYVRMLKNMEAAKND